MIRHGLWLVSSGGSGASQRRIDPGGDCTLVVGRDACSDVVIDDAAISRSHTQIRIEGKRLLVRDLGSRNGTYVVERGRRRRLTAGTEESIPTTAEVHLPGYAIVPCELIGPDIGMLTGSRSREATAQSQTVETVSDARELGVEARAVALDAAKRVLSTAGETAIWDQLLEEMISICQARRGLLLGMTHGKFSLKAQAGAKGAYCLSQGFLEETLRGGGVMTVQTTGEGIAGAVEGESLADYAPGTRLTGLALRAGDGDPVGAACLEDAATTEDGALEALQMLAELAGPVLAVQLRLDRERRRREAAELRLDLPATATTTGEIEPALVGENRRFCAALRSVRRAAPSTATIMIRGPSGSGKEVLAQLAHSASPRADQPLVALNCAAIAPELVESELFGHDKGAFTGADREHAGAFERAHGGTLLLDEVGDLSLAAQAALLRTLETGEVVRVGGSQHRVDVRLIAATHQDLEKKVAEGAFRRDLYFRLKVIEVVVPALADRPEDIVPLARHFLGRYRRPDGRAVDDLSAGAARALSRYSWPGNVRELRNIIERAIVLDRDGLLDEDDLPMELRGEGVFDDRSCYAELEGILDTRWPEAKRVFAEVFFRRALGRHGGRIKETADAVGVTRRTLSTRIREHGLGSR